MLSLKLMCLKLHLLFFDEVDCADCSIFLADLAMSKEKHASKCEELDVLTVEVDEHKSRSALLGACTFALFCIRKLMRCMLTWFRLRLS
jgi:hypothetical protein